MKVFFDATPSGLQKYQQHYHGIAKKIEQLGHQHTSDFIRKFDENFFTLPKEEYAPHYIEVKQAIDKADVIVVEVSRSSTATGQVIQYALSQKKPIVAMKTTDREDVFLVGAGEVESKVLVVEYNLENLESELEIALDFISDWLFSRFTLLLDGQTRNLLDQVSKKGLSRSEYIRTLIREAAEKGEK